MQQELTYLNYLIGLIKRKEKKGYYSTSSTISQIFSFAYSKRPHNRLISLPMFLSRN